MKRLGELIKEAKEVIKEQNEEGISGDDLRQNSLLILKILIEMNKE